jgi:phage FluMu protein Com
MAIGNCPECNGRVSSTAASCPHCGNIQFRSLTGTTLAGRCPRCKGSGVSALDEDTALRFGYSPCSSCNATGRIDLVESRNLVDGSLSYREQTPSVALDLLTKVRLGPTAPMPCPQCNSPLIYMRTDNDSDGRRDVYRCGRPDGNSSYHFYPCSFGVFCLLPDGRLVTDHR